MNKTLQQPDPLPKTPTNPTPFPFPNPDHPETKNPSSKALFLLNHQPTTEKKRPNTVPGFPKAITPTPRI
jgi:hypothetical protein